MAGRLVLMGSGEMSPTMVSTHRTAIEAAGAEEVVVLDAPFGFQENVEVLTQKITEFFDVSLVTPARVATLRSTEAGAAEQERALALVRRSKCVFAGPGSPSYALATWKQVGMASALTEVIGAGGSVVLSSAAALTAGEFTLPVYEIYKAGIAPFWLEGMDLTSRWGLAMTVVPHWNNADGGNHDTSRCFIGRRRFELLEAQLEHDVLGIDEHTAVTLDFDGGKLCVTGASTAVIRGSETVTVSSGESIELERVRDIVQRGVSQPAVPDGQTAPDFFAALSDGDVDGAVAAALAIENGAAADPGLRRDLRSVIAELGESARNGLADPREAVAGYVETLLELRALARSEKLFDQSDRIRDRLSALGIEVRDTPDGVEWDLL